MEAIQIEFSADDNESRLRLASCCEDAILTEPMYFSGEHAVISIMVFVTAHTLPAIMAIIREHIKARRYIKVKLPGGLEVSGARMREVRELLEKMAKDK
jgi:hypothetical protein